MAKTFIYSHTQMVNFCYEGTAASILRSGRLEGRGEKLSSGDWTYYKVQQVDDERGGRWGRWMWWWMEGEREGGWVDWVTILVWSGVKERWSGVSWEAEGSSDGMTRFGEWNQEGHTLHSTPFRVHHRQADTPARGHMESYRSIYNTIFLSPLLTKQI